MVKASSFRQSPRQWFRETLRKCLRPALPRKSPPISSAVAFRRITILLVMEIETHMQLSLPKSFPGSLSEFDVLDMHDRGGLRWAEF
jgi:hypothetical protein